MVLKYVHKFFNMPPPEDVIYFPRSWMLTGLRISDEYNMETGKMTVQKPGRYHVNKWSPVISY